MTKLLRSLAAFSLLLSGLAVSGASAREAGPGPHFASENVEWLSNIPLETDTAGAKIIGKYMYITTGRGLTIYDLSDPVAPKRMGTAVLPQTPQFSEEDVDSNGRILLVSETVLGLHIFDVEDKSNPVEIGLLRGAEQHTWSCVLNCRWAYGSGGKIADLRDPTKPKLVKGGWGDGKPAKGGHDVTEIAPGLIVTSSTPVMYLDARKDPTKPQILAVGAPKDDRLMHNNYWPRGGKDKFLLMASEGTGNCGGKPAGFMTWDATKVKSKKTFKMIDEFFLDNGLPTEGKSPYNTFCAHWFEHNKKFKNGGLVAMAWYEHGTRFLRVSSKGKISEVDYFVPVAGATSGIYWVTDRILYAVDYQRGIDILKYNGKL